MTANQKPDFGHFKVRCAAYDGNWLLHRNMSSLMMRFTDRVAANWERYLVDMTIGQIARITTHLKATELVVFFDGEHNFRYDIFPGYKAKRRDKQPRASADVRVDDASVLHPMQAFPILSQTLIDCGYSYSMVDRYEGDDLLASLARHFKEIRSADGLFLVTRDKDILQCLAPNVVRYTPPIGKNQPERFVTIDNMTITAAKELSKGLTPYQSLVYQVLAGDTGDDVPGVIGPKAALSVVRDPSFTTLTAWLQGTELGRNTARTRRAELNRNAHMVKLVDTLYVAVTEAHPKLDTPRTTLQCNGHRTGSNILSQNTMKAVGALAASVQTRKAGGLFARQPADVSKQRNPLGVPIPAEKLPKITDFAKKTTKTAEI